MIKSTSKKMRSGFTMVELLFVMAVLAALAAIAIPQLAGGKDSAIVTSLQSDARNTINEVNTYYALNQDLPASKDSLTDGNGDGLSDNDLGNKPIPVSKNNTVSFTNVDGSCYTIKVKNSDYTDKEAFYDSCNSGKVVLQTPAS